MSKLHRHRATIARQDVALFDALEYHNEIKNRWKEWNKKHYSGKRFKKRKSPWYIMTKGKQYNYEERTMSYGQCIDYFRVPSEACLHNKVSIINTHEQYLKRLIDAKLKDWEKKHPRPVPYDPVQKDLFEAQFMLPWIDEHTKAREDIVNFVNNIGNKVFVYARYVDDIGYPHKILEFRSDNQKLMILDGKYANHLGSKTIQRVQSTANRLGRNNPRLIALKIVDGSQECILIPNRRVA